MRIWQRIGLADRLQRRHAVWTAAASFVDADGVPFIETDDHSSPRPPGIHHSSSSTSPRSITCCATG